MRKKKLWSEMTERQVNELKEKTVPEVRVFCKVADKQCGVQYM